MSTKITKLHLITPEQYKEWITKNLDLPTLTSIYEEYDRYEWYTETPPYITTLKQAIKLGKELQIRELLEHPYKLTHNIHHFIEPPTFEYQHDKRRYIVTSGNHHIEINPDYPRYNKLEKLIKEVGQHIESKKYWEHNQYPTQESYPRTLHTERLVHHQKALERLQKKHHDKYEQLLNANTNDTTKKQLKKEIDQIIEEAITHKEAEEHYKRNLEHLTLLNAKEPTGA